MSIFHLTVKRGSRSANRLSVDKHDYIMRAGRFANRHDGDLAYREDGNLPLWALADPRTFWAAADANERANAALYHEVEFALPRELGQMQQIAAARELARAMCGDQHPYSWGLHAKDGNPHVHLIFSGRMLDGIDRDADQFFKRYNAKMPEKGGCRKEASGDARGPDWVTKVRQDWQDIANRHLAAAGVDARVDHRSHKARGLNEAPGVHMGRRAARLEQRGKSTWRGIKNREAQRLNSSLKEIRSTISEKENSNGKRHGRTGTPHPPRAVSRFGGSHHGVHGVQSGAAGGLYALEPLDRRQLFKARILQAQYQGEIEAALAARLAHVACHPDRLIISLKDGAGRVVDAGDRLLTLNGRDPEIQAAIVLAQAKGWTTLNLTGTDDFKARAWLQATRAGLAIAGYEPPAALRAQFDKEKRMLGLGTGLTPDSAALDPQAAAKRRWEAALRGALEKLDDQRKTAAARSLFDIDQHRKLVGRWLAKLEQQGRVDDDLLWQIRHHEAELGKSKPAALVSLFQLANDEVAARKKAGAEEREAQVAREVAAQQQADAIADQLAQPGLAAERIDALEAEQRYFQALADGYDEDEAKERAANPKPDAPRPR